MFCSECGRELTDDMNFCPKCGRPLKAGAGTREPTGYDVCTFEGHGDPPRSIFNRSGYPVWIEAVVDGNVIASSDVYHDFHPDLEHWEHRSKLHEKLVAQLASQGWEVMTTNQKGVVLTMRRAKRP